MLTPIQVDAIGEIMNISLGSSATSMSNMLDRRVTITTPVVSINTADNIEVERLEPAIGVEINYIAGISGTNIMVWKEKDVKAIVGILLGTDFSDPETPFVMDEMSVSAICEIMNQMMGASATALSQFLGRTVDISPPASFQITDVEEFKQKYYGEDEEIVQVAFTLMIADLVESEFISVLPQELALELIASFAAEEEPEAAPEPEPEPEPAPAAAPAPAPQPAAAPASAPQPQPRRQQARTIVPVSAEQPVYDSFDDDIYLTEAENQNLGMVMAIPVEVTVEIGRVKRKIKDILDFQSGTIIELNKQAGAPVDIFVNGQPVAKGDVVVIDDNYGVRITEVSSNADEILKMI